MAKMMPTFHTSTTPWISRAVWQMQSKLKKKKEESHFLDEEENRVAGACFWGQLRHNKFKGLLMPNKFVGFSQWVSPLPHAFINWCFCSLPHRTDSFIFFLLWTLLRVQEFFILPPSSWVCCASSRKSTTPSSRYNLPLSRENLSLPLSSFLPFFPIPWQIWNDRNSGIILMFETWIVPRVRIPNTNENSPSMGL